MSNVKYYYRFEAVGIDWSSEKDIKKHNKELISFDDLSDQFDKLKAAFDNASKERADIAINAFPLVSGWVAEFQVYHNIKYKLFSKEVKNQNFALSISKYNNHEELGMYDYFTTDFGEVKQIFYDIIVNQKLPELSKWKYTHIGE